MDALTLPQLLTIGVFVLLLGMAIGWGLSRLAGSRPDDGEKVKQLETELSAYKQEVTGHFQETATLLQEMTDRYKTVYEHMAVGARNLCDNDATQLQHLQGGLLTAADTDRAESDIDAEIQPENRMEPDAVGTESDVDAEPQPENIAEADADVAETIAGTAPQPEDQTEPGNTAEENGSKNQPV